MMHTGEQLRDKELDRLATVRADLVLRARVAFARVLIRQGRATADDWRSAIEIPPGVNPNCMGCVPAPFAGRGWIEKCGFQRSARAKTHAHCYPIWRLVNLDAVVKWLRENTLPWVPIVGKQGQLF